MAPQIQFVRLEIHQPGTSTTYYGDDGYRIGDKGGISVTFLVNERDGGSMQLTQVIHGQFTSYDDAVDAAYLALERRLEGFGQSGQALREHREKLALSKAAEQKG